MRGNVLFVAVAAVIVCVVIYLLPGRASTTVETMNLTPRGGELIQDSKRDDVAGVPQVQRPIAFSPVSPRARASEPTPASGTYPSIPSDVKAFQGLAHRCTDKTTSHRYEDLYARMLYPMRHEESPKRLLEVGLGCDMHCVAGGARLFTSYFNRQHVTYHTLEFNPNQCRARYPESSVDAAMAQYIDSHLCSGSSADHNVLKACGDRFGPFDAIIDDASHLQSHVVTGFQYWFPSSYLKRGGVYIVEDLQVIFWPHFEAADARNRQEAAPPAHDRHFKRQVTFGNVLQGVLLCKFSGLMCENTVSGQRVGSLSSDVSRVAVMKESGALRKR